MDTTQTVDNGEKPEISLFLPVLDEEENLAPMHAKIAVALDELGRTAEVIFVDDGSTDRSLAILKEIAAKDDRVRVISLRRNYGQTAAMAAGIDAAKGEILIPMDADLQNDPADIKRLLEKLDEGYDVVSGWRKNRQDKLISRKIPSQIANRIISWIGGVHLHDYGCSLKAYRRDVLQDVKLYGEMHRFIPILAHQRGARCVEVVTRHHPRRFGQTKYGISRTFRVVLDLMTVTYLLRYFASPMKLFGMAGLGAWTLMFLAGTATVAMKLGGGVDMTGNPLLLLTALSMFVGVQFFSLGLIGEVNARIYYSDPAKPSYAVRERVNFETAAPAIRFPRAA